MEFRYRCFPFSYKWVGIFCVHTFQLDIKAIQIINKPYTKRYVTLPNFEFTFRVPGYNKTYKLRISSSKNERGIFFK